MGDENFMVHFISGPFQLLNLIFVVDCIYFS